MVLSSSIDAFGAIGSSILGGVIANHSAYKQYKYQKMLQSQAAKLNYDYGIKSLQNSPSATRHGLESAGYNPMLAVQNATSGANAGWTSTGQSTSPDIVGGMSAGLANAMSFKRLKNETEQIASQIDANEATAENQRAEASNKRAQNPFISKQAEANLRKTDAETTKLNSDTEYNSAVIDNMKSRLELDRALGFAGLDVQRRGQDLSYNASTYASNVSKYGHDVNERNNMRTNRVNTSLEHIRHPYASFFHKSYTSGKDYNGSYSDPWK